MKARACLCLGAAGLGFAFAGYAQEPSLLLQGGAIVLPGEVPYVGLTTQGVSEVELRVSALPDPLAFFALGTRPAAPLRRFTLTVHREADDSWSRDTLALFDEGAPAGAYLVEAVAGDKQASTVVLVSGLRMVAKHDESGTLVFVADARSGRPAGGVDVFVVQDEAGVPARAVARTSALGTAKIPGPIAGESFSVYARRGADFVGVQALRERGTGPADEASVLADVETDRPMYRPGQEVHFKATLRLEQLDGSRRLPGAIGVTALARDQRYRDYYREDLTVSEFGTVHGRFRLPREAPLGYHAVGVRAGKWSRSVWFRVDEYRKPSFRVQVGAEPAECSPGDPLKLVIGASYYSGESVGAAAVDYELWGDSARGSERLAGGQGTLDASGQLEVRLAAPGRARPGRLRIVASVTDAANRRITGAGTVRVVPGEGAFTIAMDSDEESIAGQPLLYALKTTVEDLPVSRPLKLRVTRERWERAAQQRSVQHTDTVHESEARTDASGRTTLRLVAEGEGNYCLDAGGEDARGRRFEERYCVWVPGARRLWAPLKRLSLEPERDRYAPGDEARLRLVSPVEEGTVLVTVEGTSLIEHRVLTLTGGRATIPVAIEKAFSPNVHVVAILVSRGRFYYGSTSLNVPAKERSLDVAVRTDRAAYEPGETAEVEVRVTDALGRPAQAELSLKAVDEAIYAVAVDNVAPIERVFNGPRYTRVATHMSQWDATRHGACMVDAGDGPQADADVPEARIRKRFVDTLFWEASARSGPDGVVRMRVPLADNLTTWRVVARGADRDTRVGQGAAQFRSSRPVTVRLGLPRFLGERDRATVTATVHNASERAIRGSVRLRAAGVELEDAAERPLSVEAGATATLAWSCAAKAAGTARFTASLVAGEVTDGEELEIPIHRHGLEVVETASRVLAKEREAARLPPPPAKPEEVTIELAPSLAGPALAGVEYLLRYPYGCVEQTLSGFLPAVLMAGALRDLGAADEGAGGRPDVRVRAREGLLRLYGLQNGEGGWGWWSGSSDGFITAYVVYGLAQARRAGLEVDETAFESALHAARNLLGGRKLERPLDRAVRAYLVYALAEAGAADEAATRELFERRNRDGSLSAAARALLTLALARQGDRDRAAEALAELLAMAQSREGQVSWPPEQREARWRDDEIVATALALQAILAVAPERPEADAAVRWLMARRLGAGHWRSTLDTALVLYGLADHLRARRAGAGSFDFEIVAGGKVLERGRFTPDDLLRAPRRFSVPAAALDKPLELRKRGGGALYATLTRRSFTGGEPVAATARGSVSLERSYVRLRPERGSDGALSYRREPLGANAEIARGDLLLAVLAGRLPAETEYFMLEDRLPSGFEVLGRPKGIDAATGEQEEQSLSHMELRDDRVAFFVASPKGGTQRWSYVLRAEAAGQYHVPPARAELMYYPETRATSAEGRIRVR